MISVCVAANLSLPPIGWVPTDELDKGRTSEIESADFFEVSVTSKSGSASELAQMNQYVRSMISLGMVSIVAGGRVNWIFRRPAPGLESGWRSMYRSYVPASFVSFGSSVMLIWRGN